MKVNQRNRLKFWLQWITANALGELLGLGTVAIMGFLIASKCSGLQKLEPRLAKTGVFGSD